MLLVFFLPTAIQLHHTFENHEHTVCTSKIDHHIHEQKEIDCKLCDFTFSGFIIPEFSNISDNITTSINVYPNFYHFLSDYKKLHFSLRGPPTLV